MRLPEGEERPEKKVRQTKWASEKIKVFIPGSPLFIPPNLDPNELEALLGNFKYFFLY